MPVTKKVDVNSLIDDEPQSKVVDVSSLIEDIQPKKKVGGGGLSVGQNGKLQTSSPTPSLSQSKGTGYNISQTVPEYTEPIKQPTPPAPNVLSSATELQQGQKSGTDKTGAPIQTSVDAENIGFQKAHEQKLQEQNQKVRDKAIENTVQKSLKLKGINSQPGSLLYNIEKSTFNRQLDDGNATIGQDEKGNLGLNRTTDALQSAKNGWNAAVSGNKESDDFVNNMTTQQQVDYLKQKQVNQTPYLGTKPTELGSVTGMVAQQLPFMAKAAIGYGLGTGLQALAPETGGLSELALPKVLSFIATSKDMANQTAMQNIASRYQSLKNQHPDWTDNQAMDEANKDKELDKAQGLVTNYLFNETLDGNKPVAGEAKNTITNSIKGLIKSSAAGGGKVAAVNVARDLIDNYNGEGKSIDKIASDAASSFIDNAGTIGMLHLVTGAVTGAFKLPKIIESAAKNVLAKENPDHINSVLEANVQTGNLSPEDAQKVSADINDFKQNLGKVMDESSDEVKASVAGLIQKRTGIEQEAATKDATQQDSYKQQIDAINQQISEIQRTGKPLEHEIDEATGQTYEKPTYDNIAALKVKNLADKISKGKSVEDPEDLQTEQNFPNQLETKLKSIANEEQAGNKGKENATTELSDNVNKYLDEKNKAKTESKMPDTTEEAGTANEGTDKNIQLTENEQKVIDAVKGKKFDNGGLQNIVSVLQDDNAPVADKRQALSELSDQLSDPKSEVLVSTALGAKAGEALYDLVDENKRIAKEKAAQPEGKGLGSGVEFVPKKGREDAYEIHKNGERVGDFELEKNDEGDWTVGLIGVAEKSQRQGIAKEAYIKGNEMLQKKGEGVLHSSGSYFEGTAKNIWKSLVKDGLAIQTGENDWRFRTESELKLKKQIDNIGTKQPEEIQSQSNINQNEKGNKNSQGGQRDTKAQEVTNKTGVENEAAPVIQSQNQTNQDAIQEPQTGTVLQREQSETGETGGERQRVESGQQGEETPIEGEGEEKDVTSIKNAFTQAKREELGLNEEIPAAKKEFGKTLDEAKGKIDGGYNVQDLIDELKAKPRPLTDVENAMLLVHQNGKEIQLINTNKFINDAAEKGDEASVAEGKVRKARLLDELQSIYDVDKAVGTENARGLAARKMMIDRKYSLANMVAEKRASANDGKPLSEDQTKEVEELHAKLKEAQAEHDKYVKEAELEIKDLQEKILAKKVPDKKTAAQKLRDIADRIDKAAKGQAYASVIPITPKMISGAIRLVAAGLEKGGELLDLIKNAIDEIKKSNPGIDEAKLNKAINKELINSGINSNKIERSKAADYSGLFDRKEFKLRANVERAKSDIDASLKKDEAAKRSRWQKVQDTFVKWQRAFKLSNPITLGKLTMAAITRSITTPLEDVVGGIYSKIFPKLSKGAIGEGGGFSAKETAKAVSSIMEGLKDAEEIMKKGGSGKSDIDVVFGKNGQLPPEAIDFFGHLHSAIKAPIKRAIFEKQLAKRWNRSANLGLDTSDPMVQTEIMIGAYKDANRAIFMQDNKVSEGWQRMIKYFESTDKKTGKPNSKLAATTLQWLIPFIKVPTNIAAEIGTNVYGVPVAGAKLLYHAFTNGIKNINPDEKDVIMRELKKGSLGAVALTLGYMNPQTFGGYYQQHEKRKPGDVKAGNVKIGGIEIPAWAIESPIFQAMQIGATVRRVKDERVKGQEKGIKEGVWAGALGLADHVPLIDQPMRIAGAISNPKERQYYLGELAKGTVVPAAISKTAEWTDPEAKRNPTTIGEHIETGIPGLREEVAGKKEGKGQLHLNKPKLNVDLKFNK